MGFVAQLEEAPPRVAAAESKVLQRLTACPRYALTNQCLHHLSDCGLPVSFMSLQAMNMAALYRTAACTSKCWRAAQSELAAFRANDEECTLAMLGGYDTLFDHPAIVDTLDAAAGGGRIPSSIVSSVDRAVRYETTNHKSSTYSVQKIAYKAFLEYLSPFSLGVF